MTKILTRNNYIMGNILMCTVNITVVKLLNRDVLHGWDTKWTRRKWEWGKGLVWQSRSKRPFENIEAQCQNRCQQWTTMLWTWQGYEDYSPQRVTPFTVWYMFTSVLEKHSVFSFKEHCYLSTKLQGVVTYFLSILSHHFPSKWNMWQHLLLCGWETLIALQHCRMTDCFF
jgi:hypothetical protein